jgi:hypothetical protein
MKRCALRFVAAAPALFSAAAAGEWDIGGEIAGEIRYFPSAPAFPDQLEHWQPSATFQPDIRWESGDGRRQFVLTPFARLDAQDDARTHLDLREAYYRHNAANGWSVLVGAAKIFWGRTESRHLVDIINQTDAVEDIDEEDKLGQPMINLTAPTGAGTFDVFLMSGFRTRTFPGEDGRLRFSPAVDTDEEIINRNWGRGAIDVAARYSHYIGAWDFGVSVFHGTSREPRFALGPEKIRPVYDKITQASIDLQYTKDAWLWKAEGIVREGQGDTFFAGVGGFEYTLYQLFGSNADLGLLLEYQYDGRDEGVVMESYGPALAAPVTAADNDVFAGARLGFNDAQDASALVGMSVDAEDQSMGMFIEASRRIGANWTAELETRLFFNADPDNIASVFRKDDFITLRLTRYY